MIEELYITYKPKAKKCEHNKEKRYCKECGGTSFCKHNRQKSQCKDCGGSSICEHNIVKSQCKKCGGGSICEHNKVKSRCKDCGGGSICEHNKRKPDCKECGGTSFCKHNRQKSQCKDCGGGSICEHNRIRSICKDCGGGSICEHNKQKSRCKECGGSQLCKAPNCETRGNKKYNGYCLPCVIHLHPEIKVARNYKTKEKDVVDRIIQSFPDFTWVHDKRVQDGCSRRRPDLLLDMGNYIIIVEIDENKHSAYDCSCENKRLMLLSQDLQHRPIIFIRFNPDSYTSREGITVSSCWEYNKLGIVSIKKSKREEWENRIQVLKNQIEYWIENSTQKTIELIELFYE